MGVESWAGDLHWARAALAGVLEEVGLIGFSRTSENPLLRPWVTNPVWRNWLLTLKLELADGAYDAHSQS